MKKLRIQDNDRASRPADGSPFFREIQIEFLVHEMKDPVSVIETGVRTLLERQEKYGSLSDRQDRTLKRILRNVKKTQAMVNDLLEIGRSEGGCFACCHFSPGKVCIEAVVDALEMVFGNVADLASGAWADKATIDFLCSKGILFECGPGISDLELLQDEIKFRQIIGNLVKNALYHRKTHVEIKLGLEKDHLIVSVSDDGPGIEPAHHRAIFKRYRQLGQQTVVSRKGHGIGLAGALICAKSMGGDIQVESEKDSGATFRLILPIVLETRS